MELERESTHQGESAEVRKGAHGRRGADWKDEQAIQGLRTKRNYFFSVFRIAGEGHERKSSEILE